MNDNKLILTKYKDFNAAFLFKDGDIDELILSKETAFNVGDIYVGRVNAVKNDLNACFVDFGEKLTGYLPFEEILPECLLNRPYDGRLMQGDLVCVQVIKEPLKTKGATLSMRLTITSSYTVVTLDDKKVHFSSKLPVVFKKEAESYFNGIKFDYGFIVRTNSAGISLAEIEAEAKAGMEKLKKIISAMKFRNQFTCLHHAESAYYQRIRSVNSNRYDEAVTDIEEFFEDLKDLKALRIYSDKDMPLKAIYSFDKAFSLATDRKVDIKYGGYLYIEPTEALTVIDVNSGKFSKKMPKEEAIKKVNIEAAIEIARQLRLRNISGMILVDFINQKDKNDLENLKSVLVKELKKDSLKASFVDFTPLGLAEITREKRYGSIYEQLK